MKNTFKLLLTLLIVSLISIIIYLKFIKNNSIEIPKITLNGKNIITLYQGQTYQEPGYKATDEKDATYELKKLFKLLDQCGNSFTRCVVYEVNDKFVQKNKDSEMKLLSFINAYTMIADGLAKEKYLPMISMNVTSKKILSDISARYNLESKYEKYTCRNKSYYFDEINDITIINYDVKSSFPFNEIYITYNKGKFDNNYCNKVIDPTKTNYQFKEYPPDGNPRPFTFIATADNGDKIMVYYNIITGRLLFKTGNGYMNYLESMIQFNWLTMSDVIKFLEYKVMQKEATVKEDIDIGYTLYTTKDFSLLKCHTQFGNNDIYIEEPDFEYNANYCQ